MKQRYFLITLLCLTLSGCATSDYETSDQQQQKPSGMSGGGMGQGGGGGGGGGSQQGPPNMQGNGAGDEMPLPEEAFTACVGKKVGDLVVLILAEGKEIQATCTLMNDQMVAVPQQKKRTGRR